MLFHGYNNASQPSRQVGRTLPSREVTTPGQFPKTMADPGAAMAPGSTGMAHYWVGCLVGLLALVERDVAASGVTASPITRSGAMSISQRLGVYPRRNSEFDMAPDLVI